MSRKKWTLLLLVTFVLGAFISESAEAVGSIMCGLSVLGLLGVFYSWAQDSVEKSNRKRGY